MIKVVLRGVVVSFLGCLMAGVPACSGPETESEGDECANDGDCPAGDTCVAGSCREKESGAGGGSATTGGGGTTTGGNTTTSASTGGGGSGASGSSGGAGGGAVCVPSDGYCSGDTLHYCDGSTLQTLQCTDAGCQAAGYGKLKGCEEDGSGVPSCICESICETGTSECTGPDQGHDCIAGDWGPTIQCDDFCDDVTSSVCLNGNCNTSLSCHDEGNQALCDCRTSCDNVAINTTTCNSADPGNAMFCASSGGQKVWAQVDCFDLCVSYGYGGTYGCGPVGGGMNYCQCY